MPFPPFRQPIANRQAVKINVETKAFVVPNACISFDVDAALAMCARRKIDPVKREQGFSDEYVLLAQIKIRVERHLQGAPGCSIVEVAPMRRNVQSRTEKTRSLTPDWPGDIGRL